MSSKPSIVMVPLDDIHPAPWNVRTGHAVDAIAESIRINGFRDPIEVWEKTGEIVCGEGRWLAAKQLDMATVPVIYHAFDSLAAAKRYAIANNRLTDQSLFDLGELSDSLAELELLDGTGFDQAEAARLAHAKDGASAAVNGDGPSGPSGIRSAPVVKMIVAVGDVSVIERALAASNGKSRGEKLLEVCRAYLERSQIDGLEPLGEA